MAQTRNSFVVLLFAAALVVSTVAHAAPPATSARPSVLRDGPPVFPLVDVKRGLRGEGYTVFASADGPERFEFVVLGVMKGYLGPGEDLIIARLVGEKIEHTGVISGMSGSPVFVDGKLVGAVGYRFGAFTKEPIAGITPIERMLAVGDAPTRSLVGDARARGRPSAAVVDGVVYGAPEPIAVPIAVSGLSPSVQAAFAPHFAARGLGPLVAASGGGARVSSGAPVERLFASGPVAGLLVGGDVDMAGIGTVTWVKGDRFLAFGHPFKGSGESTMPVANAEIVTTVASEAGSFKLGQATTVVGRLTDDRVHAIAGTLGAPTESVPLDIVLTTKGPRAGRDAMTRFHMDVVNDREDAPLYAAVSLANILSGRVSSEEGGTVTVRGTARFSTGDTLPIHIRESMEGTSAVFIAAALSLLGTLGSVVDQDFADVRLAAVELTVDVDTAVHARRIVAFDPVGPLVPGEKARLRVRLRPHQGPLEERVLDVTVPRALAPGPYMLVVADARVATRIELETGALAQPQSFSDVLAIARARPAPDALTAYLVTEDPALKIDGRSLAGLPDSIAGLIEGGGGLSAGLVDDRSIRLTRVSLDAPLVGEARGRVVLSPPESP